MTPEFLAPPARRTAWLSGICGLLGLSVWIGGLTWYVDAGTRTFERHMLELGSPPGSPRPWLAQRFFVEHDSYYWLAYARDLMETGGWRLRQTFADNAPHGRPMHWSHLVIWGLMGIARFIESTTGATSAHSLELAGRLLLPMAGIFCFSAFFMALGRRTGWFVAVLATAALATDLNVLWEFHALRPDHHGFQLGFALGMWICLLLGGMGWTRKPGASEIPGFDLLELAAARRWFRAAGVLGGLALWTGATVFFFSLVAAAAAGVAAMWALKPGPSTEDPELVPGLWRIWARWGAATALLFYALEYAPHLPGMRLEANHPLYAICWLGIGECLRGLSLWRRIGVRPDSGNRTIAAAGLLAAVILPLLLLFGPVDWFWPRTEIMLRLHARNIIEFHSLFLLVGSHWGVEWLKVAGIGAPAIFGVAWFLSTRRAPRRRLAPTLTGAWIAALVFNALFFWQVRWAPFASAFSLLLAGLWLAALRTEAKGAPAAMVPRWAPATLAALMALQALYGIQRTCEPLVRLWRVERIDPLWLKALLQRNLMLQLKALAPAERLRLVLPAEMAPALYYFGVGDSIGSLYWENVAGLTAATEFLADALPGDHARRLAQERGITHVLISDGAADALFYNHLATGSQSHPEAAVTVGGAAALSGSPVPAWLELDTARSAAASRAYALALPANRNPGPINLPVHVYRVK